MTISNRGELLSLLTSIAGVEPKVSRRGTAIYRNLPTIGRLAYLFTLPAPLDEGELDKLEIDRGRQVPHEYTSFLRNLSNGAWLFWDTISLYGPYRSPGPPPHGLDTPNTLEFPDWATDQEMIIGGYSDDGSLLVASTASKVITCRKLDTGEEHYRWADFDAFLSAEIARLHELLGDDPESKLADDELQLRPG